MGDARFMRRKRDAYWTKNISNIYICLRSILVFMNGQCDTENGEGVNNTQRVFEII